MEVLDNLPHDKATLCKKTGEIFQGEIQSILRDSTKDQHSLEEVFMPMSDDLLRRVLSMQDSYMPSQISDGAVWIPTVACGILDEIFQSRPLSSLLFADFDWLPSPQLEARSTRTRRSLKGANEPLVTCMDDVDHECYLNAPPFCDILFPSNFHHLSGYTRTLLRNNHIPSVVNVMKQREFLFRYGHDEIHETKSTLTGYNPLLSDFTNCSVMTVSSS